MLLCEPVDDQITGLRSSHRRKNQEKLFYDVSRIAFDNAPFKAVDRIKRAADCRNQRPDFQAVCETCNDR